MESKFPCIASLMLPHELREYVSMCEYHQTSPESSFTRRRICTLAKPDGRITLAGMRLIETKNGSRHETLLTNEAELRDCLREQFGVELRASADWARLMA